jgi:hypothetical protein
MPIDKQVIKQAGAELLIVVLVSAAKFLTEFAIEKLKDSEKKDASDLRSARTN